jgi:hypothetical protein
LVIEILSLEFLLDESVYTPDENGHPFRSKADSDSGVIRTLIPAQGGRIFRIAGIDIT